MSYQVLARTWRPQTFEDLIGQDPVTRILINSLAGDRLHPALIFAGPRGTGKTSTARILAKTLNCPKAKTSQMPCNQCKSCHDIDVSRHVDVLEIDGASNNGVDEIRSLKETISYLPTGSVKVYIIDEVHMLSVSAFNALLKTLEEPPPRVVFIMATTEMRKIPLTVLSRCQVLQFHLISDQLIFKQLKKICEKEKTKATEEALWLLTREAQGSLRDAQGLLDQMITFCDKQFNEANVSEVLGLSDRSLVLKVIESLLKKQAKKLIELLTQIHSKGLDPNLFLRNLIEEFRNLLLIKTDSRNLSPLLSLSEKEQTELKTLIHSHSLEDIHFLFDMALKGIWEVSRTQDQKIYLEVLMLRMCQAPNIEPLFFPQGRVVSQPFKKSKKPDHMQNAQKPPPHQENNRKAASGDDQPDRAIFSQKKTPVSNTSPAHAPEDMKIRWEQVLNHIKEKKPSIAVYARFLSIKSKEDNTLYLKTHAPSDFILNAQKDPLFQNTLKEILNSICKSSLELKIENLPSHLSQQKEMEKKQQSSFLLETERQKSIPSSPDKKSSETKSSLTSKDPYIKKIQTLFDADILSSNTTHKR